MSTEAPLKMRVEWNGTEETIGHVYAERGANRWGIGTVLMERDEHDNLVPGQWSAIDDAVEGVLVSGFPSWRVAAQSLLLAAGYGEAESAEAATGAYECDCYSPEALDWKADRLEEGE